MINLFTRRPHTAARGASATNMRYTTQPVLYDGEQGPAQAIVAPTGHGVTIEIQPLGYLRILAEPTSDQADNLPIFDGASHTDTMTLVEYAEHLITDAGNTALSEADQIAAILQAAGLSCAVWQTSSDERTVRYTIEVHNE